MSTIRIAFAGGKWKPADKASANVDPSKTFDELAETLAAGLKLDGGADELKKDWTLHPFVDKKAQGAVQWDQTPTGVGLGKPGAPSLIQMRAAAGAPAAPAAGQRPKTSAAAPPPPPPPKKTSASPAGKSAAPPPPPPKKGSASPSKSSSAPPPPPPPKSGSPTPVKSSGSPPPPPKKGPPPSGGTPSPTRAGAPPPPPKKTGGPPGFSPAGQTVKSSAPPPPAKGTGKTKSSAPPPPPPKPKPKSPAAPATKFDGDMLGGVETSDDEDDSDDSGAGGNRPQYGMTGGQGGGSDDSDDDEGDDSDDDSSDGGAPAGAGTVGGAMKIPMFNPAEEEEEAAKDKKKAPPAPPAKTKAKVKAAGMPPNASSTGKLSAPAPAAQRGSKSPAPAATSHTKPTHHEAAPVASHAPPAADRHAHQAAAPHQHQSQPLHYGSSVGGASADQLSAQGAQDIINESARAKAELTVTAARMEEKVEQMQKTVLLEDNARMEQIRRDVTMTAQREMEQMREQLNNKYQSQQGSVLRQQVDLEEKRAEMMESLVEREKKLYAAQTELLLNHQHRVNSQASGGSAAIEELKMSNTHLREQLDDMQRKKKQLNEGSLNHVMELQAQIAEAMSGVQRSVSVVNTTGVKASASPIRERGQSFRDTPAANTGNAGAIMRQQDLHRFLGSIGLEKYVPSLMLHEVDVSALPSMSDLDLEAVGINTVGARRRIQSECQRRGNGGASQQNIAGAGGGGGMSSGNFGSASTINNSPSNGSFINNQVMSPGGMSSHTTAAQGNNNNAVSALGGANPTVGRSVFASMSKKDLGLHQELIEEFLEQVDENLKERVATMLDTFGRQHGALDDLYDALSYRYQITRSPYKGLMLHFLMQNSTYSHLAPAVDILCDVHRGREAEYAESLVLLQLGINRQPHVWIAYKRHGHHETDDGSVEDPLPFYYYSALVNMSQWECPACLKNVPVRIVEELVYPSRVTDRDKKKRGGPGRETLEANPVDIVMCRSQVWRVAAACVALMMKHEPQRLAERDALFERYIGREHILLQELQALYGDTGMPNGSSSYSPLPTPVSYY